MARTDYELGQAVVFEANDDQKTSTVKGETIDEETGARSPRVFNGSRFHFDMARFGAQIGRIHDDGTFDLLLIVPDAVRPVWIKGARPEKDGVFRNKLRPKPPVEAKVPVKEVA